MSAMYVMRRANGDLLIQETEGRVRIPVWANEDAVARYKARNPELAVFLPARLDRSVVRRVKAMRPGTEAELFLLSDDSPDASLFDGRMISSEDLFQEHQTSLPSAHRQV